MAQAIDVVILGGGVVGCSVAYQLRRRGVTVMVLEPGAIGAQASSAATGLLSPYKLLGKPDDPYLALQRASLALFPGLAVELEELTGLSVDYHQTGCIRLARIGQAGRLEAWAATWRSHGVEMAVLQGEELACVEPALSRAYQMGVSIACEPQVLAPAYMATVARAAVLCGARLVADCQVVAVDRDGSRVVAVRTAEGGVIACGSLVLAAGAWSGLVGHELLGLRLPVTPANGQSLQVRQPGRALSHILFGEGIYLAPKTGGRLYVGATHEEIGFTPTVTAEGTARLLNAARLLVPGLDGCVVERSWAGLRPATPDRRPVLGTAPGWENVALACGHNSFGVLLSAITGTAIADLVTSGSLPDVARPFGLARFGSSSSACYTNRRHDLSA
ncbi:MAG: glycine oxidase ThiO [Ktedonobacteraceae bacterium]|nr:glycine oxidase ThiO [Ktedonobacteraceae bacterium]